MKPTLNDDTFPYFNRDINLLVIRILLEGFYRVESSFNLDSFFKGNYWKIDELSDEITDSSDYGSVEELVIHQILQLIHDLKLGKIKRVSVNDLPGITERVLREAVQMKEGTDEDVAYYHFVINQIFDLRQLLEAQSAEARSSGKPYDYNDHKRLDFTEDEFSRHLDGITKLSAPNIVINIDFNVESVQLVTEAINEYILAFSQDSYFDEGPDFRDKRLYFSKQVENFYNYISDLPLIEGRLNMSFASLAEKGFEVIKVLSYLEMKKKIFIRNWNDPSVWNIKFSTVPITLQSLVTDQAVPNAPELKTNLSFDEARSVLRIGGKDVKIRKGSDQHHLLRIIFEDIAHEWFYSEIAEKYDEEAKLDDKKFYNAAYQVNLKIIRDTQLNDVLITTNQSVRINPKYLSKT